MAVDALLQGYSRKKIYAYGLSMRSGPTVAVLPPKGNVQAPSNFFLTTRCRDRGGDPKLVLPNFQRHLLAPPRSCHGFHSLHLP